VLEHLQDINSLMVKFLKSKIKYLYISVPIFSLSTFIENVFNKVYPRQLSGGHTHLYIKKILQYHINLVDFAKSKGIKIYNCTQKGILDMYEHKNLLDINKLWKSINHQKNIG
jgi:hypothetical protein